MWGGGEAEIGMGDGGTWFCTVPPLFISTYQAKVSYHCSVSSILLVSANCLGQCYNSGAQRGQLPQQRKDGGVTFVIGHSAVVGIPCVTLTN